MEKCITDEDYLTVEQAQTGNESALFKLWQKYEPRIFRFIRISIPAKFDETDIEIIMGDVLAKFISNLPKFRGQATFKTFIYTIAKNLTYSFLRKHKNDPETIRLSKTQNDAYQPGPEEKISNTLLVQRLLNELSPNYREVLIYRFYEDMTLEEIAKIKRKSKENIKKTSQRAIKALSELYFQNESKARVNLVLADSKKKE